MRITSLLVVAVCLIAIRQATAQACPSENPNGPSKESASRTLSGKVIYHDEIRQWFGLQLDAPVCGEDKEIQLLQGGGAFEVDEGNAHGIEVFRGCRVTVHGPLGIPGTGYYSAELYQDADKIEPAEDCVLKPHLTDYSKAKPPPSVRSYRVSMRIHYQARGGHIVVTAQSGGRTLAPWQAYARYELTGSYTFYAYCADGFDLPHFKGTPEMKPWLVDNYIATDPETAAVRHVTRLHLDYTCRREPKDAASPPW
jgi:hypothetical protein